MEDLSSFWSHRLCWQTFYTAGVAAITANLLNYPFTGFNYTGRFGFLTVAVSIQVNILINNAAYAFLVQLVVAAELE